MYMKVALALLAVATAAYGQSCPAITNAFTGYMQCIKKSVGGESGFRELEEAYKAELAAVHAKCFSSGEDGKDRCVLTGEHYSTDVFGSDSVPLGDCPTCKLIAKAAISLVNSVDKDTAKCTGDIVRDKIASELKECVAAKIGDFEMPKVPDFDEDGFNAKDLVRTTLSNQVNILFQLAYCKQKNAAVYPDTQKCIASQPKEQSSRPCKMTSDCRDEQGTCENTVLAAHKRACFCGKEAGTKVKAGIEKFGKALLRSIFTTKRCMINSESSKACSEAKERVRAVLKRNQGKEQPDGCKATDEKKKGPLMCACYWTLREALRSTNKYSKKTTDWYKLVGDVKQKCFDGRAKSKDNKFTIDGAIFWGCARIVSKTDMSELQKATVDLWTGASFLGYLVDAAVQRANRFCPCE